MYKGRMNKIIKKEVRSLDLMEMKYFIKEGSYNLLNERNKRLFDSLKKILEKKEALNRASRKNLERKAFKAFPKAVLVCTEPCLENCGNRAADTPGSFCGGNNNCGWCHHTHVEYNKKGVFMFCVSLSEHEFEEEDVE